MKAYSQQEVEGVRVYFSRGMLLNQRAMQINLGGFWKLRWLKVAGVTLPGAACFS